MFVALRKADLLPAAAIRTDMRETSLRIRSQSSNIVDVLDCNSIALLCGVLKCIKEDFFIHFQYQTFVFSDPICCLLPIRDVAIELRANASAG